MEAIAKATSVAQACDAALQELLELTPERALVLYGLDPEGTPEVRAAHGVDASSVLITGEISLETLRQVLHTGEPLQLIDAQNSDLANRNSVLLSGLRSVLVVPVAGPGGETAGLLYCDNRVRSGAFDEGHLERMVAIAGALAGRLVALT